MAYYIDYEVATGRILGYLTSTSLKVKKGEVVEVETKEKWEESMSFNKISIDGTNIILDKVEWKTPKEIEYLRIENINSYTQSYIYSKYPQSKQSSANLGVYNEAYKNEMVAFIRRIIDLSNEAIENNTIFEDYKAMLNE